MAAFGIVLMKVPDEQQLHEFMCKNPLFCLHFFLFKPNTLNKLQSIFFIISEKIILNVSTVNITLPGLKINKLSLFNK